MRTVLARLVAFVLLACPGGNVWAQIAVNRDSVVLDLSRAGGATADIVVRNTGQGELEATVRLESMRALAPTDDGRENTRARLSCGARVSVSPRSIRVGPGEERTLRIVADSAAGIDRDCWMSAVIQPTRVVSRPFSTERTRMTGATVPLHVTLGTSSVSEYAANTAPRVTRRATGERALLEANLREMQSRCITHGEVHDLSAAESHEVVAHRQLNAINKLTAAIHHVEYSAAGHRLHLNGTNPEVAVCVRAHSVHRERRPIVGEFARGKHHRRTIRRHRWSVPAAIPPLVRVART